MPVFLTPPPPRDRQDDDYLIDFETAVNVPRPENILSRAFVLLAKPWERLVRYSCFFVVKSLLKLGS